MFVGKQASRRVGRQMGEWSYSPAGREMFKRPKQATKASESTNKRVWYGKRLAF